ncbi:biotin transporter BioY [Gloeocapsa sp. PCC 73106]|uniref:biotin transporter BioY n=1 Tax=Gloeocapsa sp. PCC 73106 TaxID=102232 RepID=UPI0002AC6AB3|nr:biotin transporter BioY [Gloeocapsa sp. PCC 73106]ELR98030.1 hypothetical protein GLO73106DRAFT_00018510 [Gloeocapsa sp. PCC 73106]
MKPKPLLSLPNQLLLGLIGLLLTITTTFIEASITDQPWFWYRQGIFTRSLGVTYQIGAVLLTACLGGKNVGAIAQIAYLALGLSGWSIFAKGGGLAYLQEPTFGYLLGFIPGAWVCGAIAWRRGAHLEILGLGAFSGLIVIHASGLLYLLILWLLGIEGFDSLEQLVENYSLNPFPGHLAIVCVVATLSYLLRRLLFY